jgi:protein TonB
VPSRPAVPATAAPQAPARNWAEYQVRAAQRMVAANPGRTYMGPVEEPLLAIPVLEIELKADGEIARISVKREPRQAKDTIQLAIDAVRRGAPYGDVRQLPKPWKFTEVFLFNDDRQFKPRTLDD